MQLAIGEHPMPSTGIATHELSCSKALGCLVGRSWPRSQCSRRLGNIPCPAPGLLRMSSAAARPWAAQWGTAGPAAKAAGGWAAPLRSRAQWAD